MAQLRPKRPMRFLRSESLTCRMDFFRRGRASTQWPDSARATARREDSAVWAGGAGFLPGACAKRVRHPKRLVKKPNPNLYALRFIRELYIQVYRCQFR